MTECAEQFVGNKTFLGGSHDHFVKYPVNIKKDGNGKNQYRKYGTNNMPAEGLQMIYKTHFRIFIALLSPDPLKK